MRNPHPEPLVIQPSAQHTHTIILLHGRGSNAERFAFDKSTPAKPGILESRGSSDQTLQQLFPGMKFIFPTASLRRSTARKRMLMNIWFDNSTFEDPFAREELQVDGLGENITAIHRMIWAEAHALSSLRKVFLGGLSQGCAMALHVLLGLTTEELNVDVGLGGFVGMSGWLPFQSSLEEIVAHSSPSKSEESDDDPFASESEDLGEEDDEDVKVGRFIREEIIGATAREKGAVAFRSTPVFLGHGDQDNVVRLEYGQKIRQILEALGLDVTWRIYEGQGHWYKIPDEIDHVAEFLAKHL
ncbi:MAG: hypothetical protein Q9187_009471 [Circinaria calcarea]